MLHNRDQPGNEKQPNTKYASQKTHSQILVTITNAKFSI